MTLPKLSLPMPLLSLRLFGSFSRGDIDHHSDIDVLVVHREHPTKATRAHLRLALRELFRRDVDLAEYSASRLKKLFSAGHLFAWHLRNESANLLTSPDRFFEQLGEPSRYQNAAADTRRFLELLETIPEQVRKRGSSSVYEAGLTYLASRNIGLCSSWKVARAPDFSRYAIRNVAQVLNISVAISAASYDKLIDCRFASIRGFDIAPPSHEWVANVAQEVLQTCTMIYRTAFEVNEQ